MNASKFSFFSFLRNLVAKNDKKNNNVVLVKNEEKDIDWEAIPTH